MTSPIILNTNPEEVYHKLVDIAGHNSFGLTMSYFESLYLNKDFWAKRQPYGLSLKTFNSYVEFARYEVPWGLGWDIEVIKAHCRRKPNIWQEYEEQINSLKNVGRNWDKTNVDISSLNIEGGTSRKYQIQRLKRDAPDIATKVINREISAKQGMEIAGLKDRTVVVKCKAEDFVTKAINNLEVNQIEKLIQDLSSYLNHIKQ
jgi:hypothetical protein